MATAKKTKSGKWRVLIYVYTDENGKRHYKSFTDKSKRAAEKAANAYVLLGNHEPRPYDEMTLGEAYDKYIEIKSAVLSPSTIAGYKRLRKNHFRALMPFLLKKITPQMIQAAVNEIAANHSSKTVRNAHGLLHAVISTYMPDFIFNTTLPQKIKPDYVIPTTDDITKLLEVCDDRMRVPVLLASQGSLRRSEICALTPEDFTDTGVRVNKAKVLDKNGHEVIKTTKTIAGTRFVPLPYDVIREAREWKFFDCHLSTLSNRFYTLRQRAGLPPFSFHKLRHYFASELHARGIPDKYIAEVGGWESVDMLHKIYQHTLRDKQTEMQAQIVDIFSQNFGEKSQNTALINMG